MKTKKTAFTLAETLITLAVMGVIAMMTIPSFKDYSDEMAFVAGVKKAYSGIQAATTALEAKYGDIQWQPWTNNAVMTERYKEVMNSMPMGTNAYQAYKFNGSAWQFVSAANNWFMTTDGMAWRVESLTSGDYAAIYVDTNGPRRPNRVGYDVMGFFINNEGINPLGQMIHEWGCVDYALKFGKMPWIRNANIQACPGDGTNTELE